jgi:hypothetical protein
MFPTTVLPVRYEKIGNHLDLFRAQAAYFSSSLQSPLIFGNDGLLAWRL